MKETLTKKYGPLPVWAWVLIAAIGVGGFLLWRKSQAASSSTNAASSTGSSTLPAGSGVAIVGDQGSDGWQGYNNGGGSSGGQGPGSTVSPPTPVSTPVAPTLTKQGGGYWYGIGNETPVQDTASGQWFMWLSPQTAADITGAYTRYVMTSPGVFTKVTGALLPGTPQWVPSAPPAAPVAIAPGITAQPQAVTSTGGNQNSSNPASAIAPSALQPV